MGLSAVGGLLDDKYEVLKRLASGGMGDVYLVRHRHLQQLRVVKLLRAELASDPAVSQRFQQEARVATQIKHPNVAILYDYSLLPDGRYYMVWEYIEGEDLGQRIRNGGPLAPGLAVELAIQALRGLDAIHAAGVVHRDISPDNLMLTRDRRHRELVKIIDLGLAKDLEPGSELEVTQAGAFLGKFQYCSPEQADPSKGGPLDHRSDLYSLAQVLYEMLTGMPPFDSESPHGFVVKRLLEEPIPLGRRNPQSAFPAALERVVMQGLERDRERRHADAQSFIRALARVSDRLRDVATQETRVVVPAAVAAGPATPPAGDAEVSSTGRLSKEERQELLAQIDRAAVRAERGTVSLAAAEQALRDGRFEEARQRLREIKSSHPRASGVADLERRLVDAEQIARRRQRVTQAEQMLERYLLERQQTLAGLALETLLDLYPHHPKRSDYEAWVGLLADEASQQKRAEKAFADARAAIARSDLAAARKLLEEVERHDQSGKLAGSLLQEIDEAERGRSASARAGEVRAQLERNLQEGNLRQAEQEIERLASLEVTRVTLDGYRSLLEEARQRREQEQIGAPIETRFRKAVKTRDWMAAREAARELGDRLPASPRPGEMLSEIVRLQDGEHRELALDEGVRALDRYLEAGDLGQAEVALRVLRQLAPRDRRVEDAEKRLLRRRR